jgi:hypothetical protein
MFLGSVRTCAVVVPAGRNNLTLKSGPAFGRGDTATINRLKVVRPDLDVA